MVQRLTIDGISIEEIPQEEIKYSFETIEPDLKKIIKKSYSDWIPSDIYLSLVEETSKLYMFYQGDAYIGFIITQFMQDRSTEGTLFIWASYQKPEYNYRDIGFSFVEKLAEQLKAVAIEFETSREGWKKTAPKAGYDLISYTFRKEL
jgi:hypothetical protein